MRLVELEQGPETIFVNPGRILQVTENKDDVLCTSVWMDSGFCWLVKGSPALVAAEINEAMEDKQVVAI